MIRFALVIILLTCSIFLHGKDSDAWLKGRVSDKQTGESLPGVNVLYKKNLGVVTDEGGSYIFKSESGQLNVTFRMLGYKTFSKSIVLKTGDTLVLNVNLEQEPIEIDQVVVTASRIEQRIAELTVSMSVIKPQSISNQHITNAKELIDKAPGIELLDGQASIRGGSGYSYGAGSRVLALVDGLPIVAADAGNIRWQFLPLNNLSQIEIIKGASSVAYGSSALNGVINFRTADATVVPITKAYLEGGVYDRPRQKNWIWWDSPRLFSASGFNHLRKFGKTDFGISGNVTLDQGYRQRNEDNSGQLSIKLKHFNKKEGLIYGLAMQGGLTSKKDFVLWENAETGALKQDTSTAILLKGTFFAVDPFISFKKAGKFSHDLRARFQRSDNLFPDSKQNNSEASNFYTEYQFWTQLKSWLNLNTGISQNNSRIISNFYGNHSSMNVGAFAQIELSPNERLKLVAGMRLEHNSLDGNTDKFVPLFRTGINYQLMEFTFLRTSFGQGYRFPSIAERHASTTLGAVKIFPNLYIQPESGWNAEVGVRQGIRTLYFTGQADVALFFMQNENMIEYIFGIYPNPNSETFSFGFKADNIEASRVYGFEAEWILVNQLGSINSTLSGSYVYVFPVEYNPYTGKNTGVMLKYRRNHALKLHWNSNFRKIDAGISLYLRSKILRIDDVFLNELTREGLLPGFYDYWQTGNKGHLLLDIQLGYHFTEKIKVSLVVKNLTNKEYMGRPGDIQPMRNFSLRLTGNF